MITEDGLIEADELTGLATRAMANKMVQEKVSQAETENGMVSVALLDIDRFEDFDHEQGLKAGDELLKEIATFIKANCPDAAGLARYSRDTFLVMFYGKEPEDAFLMAEKLRSHFDDSPITLHLRDKSVPVKVSLSSGVASFPSQAHDDRDLLRKAQGALLRAKEMGRGRTSLWQRTKDTRMSLKTSYYAQTQLDQLSELADGVSRSESSLLREALDDLLWKYYSKRVRTIKGSRHSQDEKTSPGNS